MEDVSNLFDNTDEEFCNKLMKLRKSTCTKNMNKIIVMKKFQFLEKGIIIFTGTESQIRVMLPKDISLMLPFIAAPRKANIVLHL